LREKEKKEWKREGKERGKREGREGERRRENFCGQKFSQTLSKNFDWGNFLVLNIACHGE